MAKRLALATGPDFLPRAANSDECAEQPIGKNSDLPIRESPVIHFETSALEENNQSRKSKLTRKPNVCATTIEQRNDANVEYKQKAFVRKLLLEYPDTLKAIKWLDANKNLFKRKIFNPAILEVSHEH